ncbi:hypothetical protein [Vibrio sp. B1Z05]|uniref:hypothetical protein n=1 Tax=Vibrio sp. B1Z05 TaxID=2654980 RepID=UPI00128E1DFB|nr:hypothetical protein [Vibrio sp. B1Z05]MPW36338.1 hypothetical protein [Vibrio sp. B1Z05]
MNLFKTTAIVSSLLMLSACNSNNDINADKLVPKLSANEKSQLNNYIDTQNGFEFSHNSPLYNALDSLFALSTQSKITIQNINPGITQGLSMTLKPGAFAKLPTKGSQTSLTFDASRVVTLSATGAPTTQQEEWHCYGSTPMTVDVDSQGMTINGTLTEYQYQSGCKTSNTKIISYNFKNAHLNPSFIFDSGSVEDLLSQKTLAGNQLLLTSIESGVEQAFGKAWLAQWQAGTESAGNDFLKLDDGRIKYQHIPASMVDYNTLDNSKLLAGTVFGGQPGSGIASAKWCRIVNIPKGLDLNSQKVQTMIAVNCARSIKRYCEGEGTNFPAGMQPATSPVAWSDTVYNLAMDNTNLQKSNNKQGHFEQHGQTQNAFSVTPQGASPFSGTLKAVYGYTAVKDASPVSPTFNNAGANSFAGHAGHCQNEMADWVMTTGLSFKQVTQNKVTGIDFLTQNFAK